MQFSPSAKGPVQAQESFKPGNRAERERQKKRRKRERKREERESFSCHCTKTRAQRPSASSEVLKFNDQKSNPTQKTKKKRSQPPDFKEAIIMSRGERERGRERGKDW